VAGQQVDVDPQKMVDAARTFEDTHDSLRSLVIGLENDFNSLSATWGGDAATQFQGAMRGFYEECNSIITSLQTLAGDVDTSALNYAKNHHMATDLAQSLGSRIGQTAGGNSGGLPGF
jgi:WXG100 family type VII secretion target